MEKEEVNTPFLLK